MLLEDAYETTMEAAKRLGRHPSYICHLARESRLRARKFGNQWHIERGAEPDEELEAYAPPPWGYISVDEAAAALGVSGAWVCNRLREGRIPGIRGGSGWRSWHIPAQALLSEAKENGS